MSPLRHDESIQIRCAELLMRPIVRFCLRRSLPFQNFLQAAKRVFIEVAEEEIRKSTHKVNVSRLSVVTGLTRKDVTRIFRGESTVEEKPASVLSKVVGQWERGSRFTTKAGEPKVLSCGGEDSEFHQLVSSVSKHINPGTVMFELERCGQAKKTPKGFKLIRRLYRFASDPREGYDLLSRDIETLIDSVAENISGVDGVSNLHIRTEYDNVFKQDLPEIRRWLINEGRSFHKRARQFLSRYDKDISTESDADKKGEAGQKVVLQAFSFTSPAGEESKS